LATVIQLRPWRCRSCDKRFYAWTVATQFARYAHCSRCGNFDLQHISRDRVDSGTLVFVKRRLGFLAYRCDPCRQKFFSILPHRKIVPSMMGQESRNVPVA
jgi:DNA-directed RNA polymerase subunit RPC12/RpoP